MVREVEIEHQLAIGERPEICALHLVDEVAPAPVGLIATGAVTKWQEQAAAVALEPQQREPDLGIAASSHDGTECTKARLRPRQHPGIRRLEPAGEAPRRVVVKEAHPGEALA